MLQRLRKQLNLPYMFISHDLALVRYLCDRILVMCEGEMTADLPGRQATQESIMQAAVRARGSHLPGAAA